MDKSEISFVVLDLAVIVLLSYVLLNLLTVPLVSPADGIYTTDREPEFVWGGLHEESVILLDDDPGFGTPITAKVSGNSFRLENPLDFGTYYWKVESSGLISETRELTIGSSVVLARGGDEVRNEGNTEILVHTDKVTGMLVGVDNSVKIGEEENVKAEQA